MFKKNEKHDALEEAISQVHTQMSQIDADSEEYDRLTNQLTKLYKLREHNSRMPVSPETLLVAGTNLLGIGMIVGHERAHVVTSKALSFITKLK